MHTDKPPAEAVYELAQAGYPTFVIGVGQEVEAFSDTTSLIANWGGHLSIEPPADFTDIPNPPTDTRALSAP